MSRYCERAGRCLCRCAGGCAALRHCGRHGHGCHLQCKPSEGPRRADGIGCGAEMRRALSAAALVAAGTVVAVLSALAGVLYAAVSLR